VHSHACHPCGGATLAKPVAAGNALVEVSVAPTSVAALIPSTSSSGRPRCATQRQIGRGRRVYSAIVQLDVAAMKRNQARLANLERQVGKLVMPVYGGRQLVAECLFQNDFFTHWRRAATSRSMCGDSRKRLPSRTRSRPSTSVVEDPERTYDPCSGAGTPDGQMDLWLS